MSNYVHDLKDGTLVSLMMVILQGKVFSYTGQGMFWKMTDWLCCHYLLPRQCHHNILKVKLILRLKLKFCYWYRQRYPQSQKSPDVFLVQHRMWLASLMQKWQSLFQRAQMKPDAGCLGCSLSACFFIQRLLLPSCSDRFSRLLGPSCTHLWITAMVCLWDVFPAQVLHKRGH